MAHAWLLSPPCQPYTRQGLQKDSDDARASSFLKILELIPLALRPPLVLFVENVVGFEASDTHSKMVEMLKKMHFVTQEFILSPLQFGVPYSRPRYFCLAKRKPLSFQSAQFNNHLLWEPSLLFGKDEDKLINEARSDKLLEACKPVGCFLEFENSSDPIKQNTSLLSAENSEDVPKKIDGQNKSVASSFVRYVVPRHLISRWGSAMDIVYHDSKRCCCFTKSYYRYVKGTGSLLATVQVEMQPMAKDKASSLEDLGLRYFTPREVANLHSFPKDFNFPQHISLRQCYALLGNSLSVAVVAPLLQYLFSEPNLSC